ALLLLAGGSARAEPRPSAAAQREARAHFKLGAEHYAAARYDQAILEYQAAYAKVPLPDILFNLGQAHRLARHREEALAGYRRYVVAQPEGVPADEARSYIAVITKSLADVEAKRKAEAAAQAEAQRKAEADEAARKQAEAQRAADEARAAEEARRA